MKASLVLALLIAGLIPFVAAAASAPTIIMGDRIQQKAGTGPLARTHVSVLYGSPVTAGRFKMRLKLPGAMKFAAHYHNDTERVTVISGTLLVGAHDVMESDKTLVLGGGSVVDIHARVARAADSCQGWRASASSFETQRCLWKSFGLSAVGQQELSTATPALQEAYRDVIAPTGVSVSSVKGFGQHVRDSAHYAGRAIDLAPEWLGDNAQTWDYIARMVSSGKFQKIGLRPALYARALWGGLVKWAADRGTEIFLDDVGAGDMLHLQVP